MATVRPNQKTLTAAQWQRLITAINGMHGIGVPAPAYRDFVALHSQAMSMGGMPWGVHLMGPGTSGRNFLPWHRRFIRQFELRLQQADPTVTLPYWDWIKDRAIPAAISVPKMLQDWSITRHWNPKRLPTQAQLDATMAITDFQAFQMALEGLHDSVHVAVGGTMRQANSPADPCFFLHHANIDRLWSAWQVGHPKAVMPNATEVMLEPPIIGVAVSTQVDITALGYQYG